MGLHDKCYTWLAWHPSIKTFIVTVIDTSWMLVTKAIHCILIRGVLGRESLVYLQQWFRRWGRENPTKCRNKSQCRKPNKTVQQILKSEETSQSYDPVHRVRERSTISIIIKFWSMQSYRFFNDGNEGRQWQLWWIFLNLRQTKSLSVIPIFMSVGFPGLPMCEAVDQEVTIWEGSGGSSQNWWRLWQLQEWFVWGWWRTHGKSLGRPPAGTLSWCSQVHQRIASRCGGLVLGALHAPPTKQ